MLVVPSLVSSSSGATTRPAKEGVLRAAAGRNTGATRARISPELNGLGCATVSAGRSGRGNRPASPANDAVRGGDVALE
jgi:hypothetical protein